MFDLLPQQMQSAVLPLPEAQPDVVYIGGTQMPNPPPKLVGVVYLGGSQLPSPPQPPAK